MSERGRGRQGYPRIRGAARGHHRRVEAAGSSSPVRSGTRHDRGVRGPHGTRLHRPVSDSLAQPVAGPVRRGVAGARRRAEAGHRQAHRRQQLPAGSYRLADPLHRSHAGRQPSRALYPFFQQAGQRAYDQAHGIITEAWSPLGHANQMLKDPTIVRIAAMDNPEGRSFAQDPHWHEEA